MNYLISPCRIADQVLCLDKANDPHPQAPIKASAYSIYVFIYAGTFDDPLERGT